MREHFDDLETRDPAAREAALFSGLPQRLAGIVAAAPGWTRHLEGCDLAEIRSRADLARLPVFRKSALQAAQKEHPPFGGLNAAPVQSLARLFSSPGPIYDPQGEGRDWWGTARGLFAAGFRRGDIVLNAFSYHATPGGFMLDSGARALGCPVVPAGTSNSETQLDLIAHFRPVGFCGTPDFLKILLDKAAEAGRDASSIARAAVSGAALPASLRQDLESRGLTVRQSYGTADLGMVAFETSAPDGTLCPGMVVNEGLILEIVRPGTNDPVPEGEVGEVVVTRLDDAYPLIRFGTGDLSALMPGASACGRTGPRIKGWMGRADQRTKVRGMFVDPAQIDAIVRRHPEIRRARLVVSRAEEQDVMMLQIEAETADPAFLDAVGESLRAVTKLRGAVEPVLPGHLPNDGKVIADERPVG